MRHSTTLAIYQKPETTVIQAPSRDHQALEPPQVTRTTTLRLASYPANLKGIQVRTSIANMYGARNRCGIYLLHFEIGEIYAGQSKAVTRRYVQHRKAHVDITHISFKRVTKKRINEEERAVIWEFEKEGFHLRNITFTSIPKGESDLDLSMLIEEQADWLEGVDNPVAVGDRIQDETLRRKYQRKYEKFLTMPFVSDQNKCRVRRHFRSH